MKDEQHYKSDAFAAIHETMDALYQVGAINKQTMREFDAACLTPVEEIPPQTIRALREREHVSQPVFAAYLNVSRNLVSDWERGVKKPSGPALRLLGIVQKHGLAVLG
ncbi:MAG: DNA-binding transcriptional regulator [Gammaproteobacteria bacterium]|nr:DNA-binding transcriptional regulator [Gammaproteobacteria bacterium]MBU1723555.1 DNA-binding transcriptional regulator [Gammaproteobacteria bacterium]MBU2004113.1 DNA-binding transcriptional regulator [Gammaproteobacteria bacterium]